MNDAIWGVAPRGKGGIVHKGLKGRARLPLGLDGSIKLAGGVVNAPHHRFDKMGAGIDRHQGHLVRIEAPLPQLAVVALDGLLRNLLKGEVDRGLDPHAPFQDRFLAKNLGQLLNHRFGYIGRGARPERGDFANEQGLGFGRGLFFSADPTQLSHPAQDDGLALFRQGIVHKGAIFLRGLN